MRHVRVSYPAWERGKIADWSGKKDRSHRRDQHEDTAPPLGRISQTTYTEGGTGRSSLTASCPVHVCMRYICVCYSLLTRLAENLPAIMITALEKSLASARHRGPKKQLRRAGVATGVDRMWVRGSSDARDSSAVEEWRWLGGAWQLVVCVRRWAGLAALKILMFLYDHIIPRKWRVSPCSAVAEKKMHGKSGLFLNIGAICDIIYLFAILLKESTIPWERTKSHDVRKCKGPLYLHLLYLTIIIFMDTCMCDVHTEKSTSYIYTASSRYISKPGAKGRYGKGIQFRGLHLARSPSYLELPWPCERCGEHDESLVQRGSQNIGASTLFTNTRQNNLKCDLFIFEIICRDIRIAPRNYCGGKKNAPKRNITCLSLSCVALARRDDRNSLVG